MENTDGMKKRNNLYRRKERASPVRIKFLEAFIDSWNMYRCSVDTGNIYADVICASFQERDFLFCPYSYNQVIQG